MKKRLKKKLQNEYNALRGARRQTGKRKGVKCINYAFLPIGERDKISLITDETIPDYSFASHWLIEAYARQDCSQVRISLVQKKEALQASLHFKCLHLRAKK